MLKSVSSSSALTRISPSPQPSSKPSSTKIAMTSLDGGFSTKCGIRSLFKTMERHLSVFKRFKNQAVMNLPPTKCSSSS